LKKWKTLICFLLLLWFVVPVNCGQDKEIFDNAIKLSNGDLFNFVQNLLTHGFALQELEKIALVVKDTISDKEVKIKQKIHEVKEPKKNPVICVSCKKNLGYNWKFENCMECHNNGKKPKESF